MPRQGVRRKQRERAAKVGGSLKKRGTIWKKTTSSSNHSFLRWHLAACLGSVFDSTDKLHLSTFGDYIVGRIMLNFFSWFFWLSSGNCQDSKRTWTWRIFVLGPGWWQNPAGWMHHKILLVSNMLGLLDFQEKIGGHLMNLTQKRSLELEAHDISWSFLEEGKIDLLNVPFFIACDVPPRWASRIIPPKKHPALHVHFNVLQYADVESETFPFKMLVLF